jgi:hypothetical protein
LLFFATVLDDSAGEVVAAASLACAFARAKRRLLSSDSSALCDFTLVRPEVRLEVCDGPGESAETDIVFRRIPRGIERKASGKNAEILAGACLRQKVHVTVRRDPFDPEQPKRRKCPAALHVHRVDITGMVFMIILRLYFLACWRPMRRYISTGFAVPVSADVWFTCLLTS